MYGICQTIDGGYAVVSTSYFNTGNHGLSDFFVIKLDNLGNPVWQKSLGGSSLDEGRNIIQATDGNIIVTGFTISNDGDVTGNHGNQDYWVVKLSATGTLLWQKTLGGSSNEQSFGLCQSNDGGYLVSGYTISNSTGDVGPNHNGTVSNDVWVVKLVTDVVPVTLTAFDAAVKEKDVACTWQTQQEQNSHHFIIERSNDASHFIQVGTIAAAGNSSSPLRYNFIDPNAMLATVDYLYYRLKVVDVDRSFKYSNTVKVKLRSSSAINIYPNPVVDVLTIDFTAPGNEEAVICIIDHTGKKLYQKNTTIMKGKNIIPVNTSSLPEGAFILSFNGRNNYLARFIKVNK